ncbi:hypothetical protein EH199_14295 [Novosphingobium sp. LASN5T]|nr:hypothetical protein EH199_14295 [Novosphingobium sp. LASN5T]
MKRAITPAAGTTTTATTGATATTTRVTTTATAATTGRAIAAIRVAIPTATDPGGRDGGDPVPFCDGSCPDNAV